MLRQQIKQSSKLALKEHWPKAIIITTVIMLFEILFSFIEGAIHIIFDFEYYESVFSGYPNMDFDKIEKLIPFALPSLFTTTVISIISFFVLGLINFGASKWYFNLVDSKILNISAIFDFFKSPKRFFKAIFLNLTIAIRIMLWSVLFIIPGTAALTFATALSTAGGEETSIITPVIVLCYILGASIMLISLIFLFIFSQRYFLAKYLLIENENIKIKHSIKHSIKYMRGSKGELATYYLTIFPLVLLGIFVIPLLFITPYINTSLALYARYFIELSRKKSEPTAEHESDSVNSDVKDDSQIKDSSEIEDISKSEDSSENDIDYNVIIDNIDIQQ